jgi:hypothetical protein
MTEQGRGAAYDRVRNTPVAVSGFDLEHLDEAFTSEHWIGARFAGARGGRGCCVGACDLCLSMRF